MRIARFALIAVAASMLFPVAALAEGVEVEVGHGSFEPAEITVNVGQKVTFTNTKKMSDGHTVVFDELDAQSGGLSKGESWSHTFDEPGTYTFRVQEHSDNTGTIKVRQPGM